MDPSQDVRYIAHYIFCFSVNIIFIVYRGCFYVVPVSYKSSSFTLKSLLAASYIKSFYPSQEM